MCGLKLNERLRTNLPESTLPSTVGALDSATYVAHKVGVLFIAASAFFSQKRTKIDILNDFCDVCPISPCLFYFKPNLTFSRVKIPLP